MDSANKKCEQDKQILIKKADSWEDLADEWKQTCAQQKTEELKKAEAVGSSIDGQEDNMQHVFLKETTKVETMTPKTVLEPPGTDRQISIERNPGLFSLAFQLTQDCNEMKDSWETLTDECKRVSTQDLATPEPIRTQGPHEEHTIVSEGITKEQATQTQSNPRVVAFLRRECSTDSEATTVTIDFKVLKNYPTAEGFKPCIVVGGPAATIYKQPVIKDGLASGPDEESLEDLSEECESIQGSRHSASDFSRDQLLEGESSIVAAESKNKRSPRTSMAGIQLVAPIFQAEAKRGQTEILTEDATKQDTDTDDGTIANALVVCCLLAFFAGLSLWLESSPNAEFFESFCDMLKQ